MGGIARIRRPYMARRLWVDAAVRLQQKFAPSQLHNSQYGAWFVLDEVQNNRCGGVFAPDRPQPRERNLFLYSNEFPASILRAEKRRTTRVDPGICSELACRAYSCFSDFWAAGLRLLNCRNLSCAFQLILVAILHALGALTAAPTRRWRRIAVGMLLAAPRDWVLVDAYCFPQWIPSHSIPVSLGGTVRTRGAGLDAGTIGACYSPTSRRVAAALPATLPPALPPPSALPDLRDPTAPGRSASPRSPPRRRRNALVPNGLACTCERGRNTAPALCPPPQTGPTGTAYLRSLTHLTAHSSAPSSRGISRCSPEHCRRAPRSASLRATSLEIIALLPCFRFNPKTGQ
ncbi:hypothetical protein B0H15DRAFT_1026227 [Mycena belliarum]|uniref:Uncharacterized protein n=1 Tax=Mycena belliarum TaxID=1033014 RepID=A0AAD6TTP3_9AGAR|nr:hypothetical protein B0H15DRAFT_1026227 [Mycena belliae]